MQATEPNILAENTPTRIPLRDWLKVVVLLGLAAYFAYVSLSGNITNYVNERFSWLSYVAVVLFASFGAASAYALWTRDGDSGYSADAHNIGKIDTWVIAVVALPLILGTLIPSRPLGADAVSGGINLSVATLGTGRGITREPLDRNVLEWLRLFNEEEKQADGDLASFNGQEAEVIGFVYREPDYPEGYFTVARFTLSCCTADASAIGLPVYAPDADLVDGEWVRVRGTFETGLFIDRRFPILQPDTLEVVEQPEHPYLYP